MRYFTLLTLLIIISPALVAQDLVQERYLDKREREVSDTEKFTYIERTFEESDVQVIQLFRDEVVVRQQSFQLGKRRSVPHGTWFELNEKNGDTTMLAYYREGEPVGQWLITDKKGKNPQVLDYDFALRYGSSSSFGKDNSETDQSVADQDEDDIPPPTDSADIYRIVEIPPQFPGGVEALMQHIAHNTVYPTYAMDHDIQGVVMVEFVVYEDGTVRDVSVVKKSPHPLLDKEAVRVVRQLPDWTPGEQRGKPVKVYYNLPIRFKVR